MNLSITGKKMNTPTITKKTAVVDSPIMVQPKALVQKPAVQAKPRQQLNKSNKITQPKKQQPIKMEIKNQVPKKVEEKVQKKQQQKIKVEKIEESKVVEIPPAKEEMKKEDVIGKVTVRYNHYKQQFETVNGILSFLPIEQKYSFSDVYRGNFLPAIKVFKSNDQIAPLTTGSAIDYSWSVEQGMQYKLEIQQDEEEELKVEKRAYIAPKNEGCPLKKNARAQQLTEQMKKLDPSELNGALHKQLLEQRDLQDVLFS